MHSGSRVSSRPYVPCRSSYCFSTVSDGLFQQSIALRDFELESVENIKDIKYIDISRWSIPVTKVCSVSMLPLR